VSRLQVAEVFSGIWSVRRERDASAAYIVKTSPGCLLVDCGSEPSGASVMQGLQIARVGLRSIRAILLTHAHDHGAAGAHALSERSGAPILCSAAETSSLPAPGADRFLSEGKRIERFLEVVSTPGHTEGHLAFYFPRVRVLFAGDALTVRYGEPRLAPDPVEPSEALESMKRCLTLGAELVLPAHGPSCEIS
jgi:glyoxylase-like metal-dependent hydrolase (beta-lactamase superfamily II)